MDNHEKKERREYTDDIVDAYRFYLRARAKGVPCKPRDTAYEKTNGDTYGDALGVYHHQTAKEPISLAEFAGSCDFVFDEEEDVPTDIGRLTAFIVDHFADETVAGELAVDVAVRLLGELKAARQKAAIAQDNLEKLGEAQREVDRLRKVAAEEPIRQQRLCAAYLRSRKYIDTEVLAERIERGDHLKGQQPRGDDEHRPGPWTVVPGLAFEAVRRWLLGRVYVYAGPDRMDAHAAAKSAQADVQMDTSSNAGTRVHSLTPAGAKAIADLLAHPN